MTEKEIIESIIKTRGTILCLGLNGIPSLQSFGFEGNLTDSSRMLIIPTERKIFNQQLKFFLSGTEWTIVNYVTKFPLNSLFIITSISDINTKYQIGNKTQLEDYCSKISSTFYLQTINIIDSFPFHTKEGLQYIQAIKTFCEDNNLGFKVSLLHGIHKYGSTDISSEKEAVSREKDHLLKKEVRCIEIDKQILGEKILDYFLHDSTYLEQATKNFKEDCKKTIDNLEQFKDILPSLIELSANSSLKDYINNIKRSFNDELETIFPIGKYLNDTFYTQYGNSIADRFKNKKDSTINETSKWCISILSYAIQQWIKASQI